MISRPVRAPGSEQETAVNQRALALEANSVNGASGEPWYRLGDELNCFTSVVRCTSIPYSGIAGPTPWTSRGSRVLKTLRLDSMSTHLGGRCYKYKMLSIPSPGQGFISRPSQEPTLLSQFAIVRQQLTVIEQSVNRILKQDPLICA